MLDFRTVAGEKEVLSCGNTGRLTLRQNNKENCKIYLPRKYKCFLTRSKVGQRCVNVRIYCVIHARIAISLSVYS